jgi:hypothetical protein
MMALVDVIVRSRSGVAARARSAWATAVATRHTALGGRRVPATLPVKDLSAIPVCGSVRPQASQRALR